VPNAAADIFRQAARLNEQDPRRRGNVVHLDDELDIIVAGDIHGNRGALAKIITYADLSRSPDRRLILQEILHGVPDDRTGHDRSVEVLLRAARLKIAHEENVIFLMGNHDLAQITGSEISKQGHGACKYFDEGVRFCFRQDAEEVMEAVGQFCRSAPLMVRCPNGVAIAHSLPSPNRIEMEGPAILEILDRPYAETDFRRGGAAYEWTWGRDHTDEQTDALARQLRLSFFILGHRHVDMGWEVVTSRSIAIASDHEHGCIVHFDTNSVLTADNITQYVWPIARLSTSAGSQ